MDDFFLLKTQLMKRDNKNFAAYIKELIVVVLGITIAFTLDNIAEINKESDERELYLEALSADLTKDIEQLNTLLDSSRKKIQYTGEMFGFIYGNAPIESYTREHVTSTYNTPFFSSNNGTYLALINSGDLKVLPDFELRQEIVSLYNIEYQKVLNSDAFIRDLTTNRIYPFILEEIAFHPREDRIMSAEPLKSNKAINLLGSYFNIMSQRNQEYQTLIDHCERVKGLINSQL